jgi:hypothetical protein
VSIGYIVLALDTQILSASDDGNIAIQPRTMVEPQVLRQVHSLLQRAAVSEALLFSVAQKYTMADLFTPQQRQVHHNLHAPCFIESCFVHRLTSPFDSVGATISVLFIHTVSVLCLPHDASLCWQGGPSYNRKTLVGNWSEDLDSEDVSALGWVRDTDASA